MLLNMQANDELIKFENRQMNTEELSTLSILWIGEETDSDNAWMYPSAKDGYALNAAKDKNDDDDDDEKEDDDDYYNEEEEEDENPFDKEPTDKDLIEEDLPIVDPEKDILDDDEEVPYN